MQFACDDLVCRLLSPVAHADALAVDDTDEREVELTALVGVAEEMVVMPVGVVSVEKPLPVELLIVAVDLGVLNGGVLVAGVVDAAPFVQFYGSELKITRYQWNSTNLDHDRTHDATVVDRRHGLNFHVAGAERVVVDPVNIDTLRPLGAGLYTLLQSSRVEAVV